MCLLSSHWCTLCTCTGKSRILEAGLLGSSALRRLPFMSRAVASICFSPRYRYRPLSGDYDQLEGFSHVPMAPKHKYIFYIWVTLTPDLVAENDAFAI